MPLSGFSGGGTDLCLVDFAKRIGLRREHAGEEGAEAFVVDRPNPR